MKQYIKYLLIATMVFGKTLMIGDCANNNVDFIGTDYGIVLPNTVQVNKITDDKTFFTTVKNIKLRREFFSLFFDISDMYQWELNKHLNNYDLIYQWIRLIYDVSESFTNLVNKIERRKDNFDEDLLKIKFPCKYLNSINDVITCDVGGTEISFQDLLNYLSSKLYMIGINILKELQSVLMRKTK